MSDRERSELTDTKARAGSIGDRPGDAGRGPVPDDPGQLMNVSIATVANVDHAFEVDAPG
jgi:hypothetical protein